MIAACMFFDSKYSIEGWLCYTSLRDLNPCLKIYILCLDERVYQECLYWQHFSGDVIPIRLYDFENHFKELLTIRGTRSWASYALTCKPFLPRYVFEKFNEELLFYCDSDLYFWENAEEIKKVIEDYSFLATHKEMVPVPLQGAFNAGFFICRNDEDGNKFLKWWEEKVIEWCSWEILGKGMFVDEGYLDIIINEPNKFNNILVCPHPGINLTYWNVGHHNVKVENDKIIIDDIYKLICFHYVSIKITKNGYEPKMDGMIGYLYEIYANKYIKFREEFLNDLDTYWWR